MTISALLALVGCQPLSDVARSGTAEELRHAIEKKGAVDAPDRDTGETPLMLAIELNPKPLEAATMLLEAGAAVDAKDHQGGTALHRAVRRRGQSLALTRLLLDKGANPNAARSTDALTPLHVAAAGGDEELPTVELLLERGASIGPKDQLEETPLHRAACARGTSVLRLLVARGANPNEPSRNGPPLSLAARCGRIEAIRALLELGADVNARGKESEDKSALETAIESKQAQAAKALLDAGANPNVLGYYPGFIPFTQRTSPGRKYVAYEELTPLHLAVVEGNLELVKALLDKGARTDMQSHFWGYALDFAVYLEKADIAELLLAHGAKAMLADSQLAIAIASGNLKQVELSLRAGADPNRPAADQENRTPLHEAALRDFVPAAELLLKAGADPSRADQNGKTPADLAKSPAMKNLLTSGKSAQ